MQWDSPCESAKDTKNCMYGVRRHSLLVEPSPLDVLANIRQSIRHLSALDTPPSPATIPTVTTASCDLGGEAGEARDIGGE